MCSLSQTPGGKNEQFYFMLRKIISGDFSQDFGLDPTFWIEHRDET